LIQDPRLGLLESRKTIHKHFPEDAFHMAADAEENSILIGARSPEERKRILGDLFTGHGIGSTRWSGCGLTIA
jgi:hypothetical protein